MNTAKILPMRKKLLSAPSLESLMYADKIPFPVNRHLRPPVGGKDKINNTLEIPVDTSEGSAHTIFPAREIV